MIIKYDPCRDINIDDCIEADVIWYSPERGYGFLRQDADSPDIMVHFSQLEKMGCPYIQGGDRVLCEIGRGRNGLQVIHIREVKFGSPTPRSLATFLNSRVVFTDPEDLEEIEGSIKWYNPNKRYGFIYPDDGRREVYLHASVIWAAGYKSLIPGTRVFVKVSTSEKGQEAQMLRVLFEEKEKSESIIIR